MGSLRLPSSEQGVLCELSHLHEFSEQLYEAGSIISSILHMGKLKQSLSKLPNVMQPVRGGAKDFVLPRQKGLHFQKTEYKM